MSRQGPHRHLVATSGYRGGKEHRPHRRSDRRGCPSVILLRRLLGDVLRRQRQRQARTLREVSAAARVSPGYLSEVERGQKEASSELIASNCAALGVRICGLFTDC